ncbi:MAG: hypothetical protein U0793_03785 [Gemmataceae bacterium]
MAVTCDFFIIGGGGHGDGYCSPSGLAAVPAASCCSKSPSSGPARAAVGGDHPAALLQSPHQRRWAQQSLRVRAAFPRPVGGLLVFTRTGMVIVVGEKGLGWSRRQRRHAGASWASTSASSPRRFWPRSIPSPAEEIAAFEAGGGLGAEAVQVVASYAEARGRKRGHPPGRQVQSILTQGARS